MKINSLLQEGITAASSPENATNSAPQMGRSDKFLEDEQVTETSAGATGAGSVASVSAPVGGMQRRAKGSIFSGIKTSAKFPNSQAVKEGDSFGSFAGLKDWQVWNVHVYNNYYRGKYADYGPRLYSVVASSPDEARQVVINNADYVLKDLLSRKLQNGKKVLPRGSALPVEEKRVGKAEPGSITTMGFKEMLTPDGPMNLKFSGGKIVASEEQPVDEGIWGDTAKLVGIPAVAGALAVGAGHLDKQQPHVEIGGQSAKIIHADSTMMPRDTMLLKGADGKMYHVWMTSGKGSGHALLASPAEEVKEAFIAPALSAANANAEYERTKTFVPRGYKGRVDLDVESKDDYDAVRSALTQAAKKIGHHVECGLSGKQMSVFSKTMSTDELDNFVDNTLPQMMEEASWDKEGSWSKQMKRQQKMFNKTLAADEKRREQRSQERNAQYKSTMQGINKSREESQLDEVNPHNYDSDVDYYAALKAPVRQRSYTPPTRGVDPDDEAYFREIFRKNKLAQQQKEREADHDRLATGTNEAEELDEKSKSQAQFRTMAAVAHNPKFAKKVGIKQSVGKEFHKADKGVDYKSLPSKVDEAEIAEDKLASELYRDLQIFKKAADKDIGQKAKNKDLSSKAKDTDIVTKEDCWDGYQQIGMKKKNGKTVPNCVPKK